MKIISWYKIKRILSDQKAVFISLAVVFLLIILVFAFYSQFNKQKKEVELLQGETSMLGDRFNTLKFNKTLTQDQIKDYNKLLASLIPETEDFFSIIYALEEISTATNFKITDYAIDISAAIKDTLTITVQGKGDTNDFLKFLQEYQFVGGRLVTSDKIIYRGENPGDTKITLNFYSKRFSFNETVRVPQLTKDEIQRLQKIKEQVKFQFSAASYQAADTQYTSKKDPFAKDELQPQL